MDLLEKPMSIFYRLILLIVTIPWDLGAMALGKSRMPFEQTRDMWAALKPRDH